MTYFWLVIAIVFEVGWAISMKLSIGFSRLGPTIATIVMYLLSAYFLSLAAKKLDLGVAYALWAGTGAALIAVAGLAYFKEPMTAVKAVSIALIVAGIVGLQLSSGGHGAHPQPAGAPTP